MDRCAEPMRVFSYETGKGAGARKFLACTYDEFWERYCISHDTNSKHYGRYSEMAPENRHHYEVIRYSFITFAFL